jgi:hypothetical protein
MVINDNLIYHVSPSNSDCFEYGIKTLYGEYVYDFQSINEEREFHLKFWFDAKGFNNRELSETVEFYAKLNPAEYIENLGGDFDNFSYVSYENICKDHAPEQYEKVLSRLQRLSDVISGNIPDPVFYEGDYKAYVGDAEFLEFTEETASSWGGPYKMGDKLGCAMKLKDGENQIATIAPINFQADWKYYNIPQKFRDTIKESDSDIYKMTPLEKENLFNSFPTNIQHSLCRSVLKSWEENNFERLNQKLPYKIYLYGNDDCSYTKWFSSQKERKQELNYLRGMQPLDFNKDVVQRGYSFTN